MADLPTDPSEPLHGLDLHAEVAMQVQWIFRVNKPEALLILKALRGTLKDAEIKHAKELADLLTQLRQRVGADNQKALDRAWENAQQGEQ